MIKEKSLKRATRGKLSVELFEMSNEEETWWRIRRVRVGSTTSVPYDSLVHAESDYRKERGDMCNS